MKKSLFYMRLLKICAEKAGYVDILKDVLRLPNLPYFADEIWPRSERGISGLPS
jgi:hypothetical protein